MSELAKVWQGPVLDNHFHLNLKGRFLDAARDFKRVGGTDLVLVHCPDFSSPPTTRNGHLESYQKTVEMAEKVRQEVELRVRVVLGPHPAAFAHQFEKWVGEDGKNGAEKAVENYRSSIDAALELIHQGKACAIGEVGRPHWPVSDEIWELSNELLLETMQIAAKENLALQLHVEGESDATYGELAKLGEKAGMDLRKLVRHYAPANVCESYTQGLTPSVLAGSGAIPELMSSHQTMSHGFLLETDYMDDPRRPGAVLGPKTVPKRMKQLLDAGIDEEVLWKSAKDLPEFLYGE